ncbi:hypothetical protein CEP51_016149 [Fusarium floridanum]|uniref:Nephrocystin 3-like N-terminal domain-containing protein n=1 Tax=Fusarium floridanum TaxID=1325733 RepID=A0A428NW94_9HYPO|nr:hypothetical protein CEP51_016149 [Fusarium floridanum]
MHVSPVPANAFSTTQKRESGFLAILLHTYCGFMDHPRLAKRSCGHSRLVDHIRTSPENKGDAVACVYLQHNHRQHKLADFDHALTSILRQLVSQLPSTSGILQQLVEVTDIPYPGDDEYGQLLHRIASEFGKAFLVFDGANSVTASALKDLMLAINSSSSHPAFRVLFASHDTPPHDFAASYQIIDIPSRAQDRDVEEYIVRTLQDVSAKNLSSGHSKLVKDLVRMFDGLFLPIPAWPVETPMPEFLAGLSQLISICGSAFTSDKIAAFCRESVVQLMASQWGDMVLCIIYHVIRASEAGCIFTISMALEALNIWQIQHQDGKRFDTSEVILGCRGLIFCGEGDEPMRIQSPLLGHYLGREVFGTDYDKRSITASLRYLSSDSFADGACTTSAALRERLQKNRYLWYAAAMLGPSLATTIPETFVQDFMQLSSRRGSIESYFQAAEAWPYESEASYDECEQDEERWRCFTPGYSPLHLAAHLAAPGYLIDALVARGEALEAGDSDGRTALHLAAEIEGDNSTIRALVGAGSNVSAEDNKGNTPLVGAVIYGNIASVKLLLDNGADLGELDEEALEQCGQEKPEIATYLRELGIDVPVDNGSDQSF